MSNTKKSVATTKSANKGVKPLVMVSEVKAIKETFGKYSIIINGNAVYRCSTDTLERGPKALYELYLPNYGKMRKLKYRFINISCHDKSGRKTNVQDSKKAGA